MNVPPNAAPRAGSRRLVIFGGGVALLVVAAFGIRMAWAHFLASDALRSDLENVASAYLVKVYPGARVQIGAVVPYGLIGAEAADITLAAGATPAGKTPNLPPLHVRLHAGPSVFFSKAPRVAIEVGDAATSLFAGSIVLERATGELKKLDGRVVHLDLATWLRPKGVKALVVSGKIAGTGLAKPITFAGKIVMLSASVELPGMAALPPSLKTAAGAFSTFENADLVVALSPSRFEFRKPLVLTNKGGTLKFAGGMNVAVRPPQWDMKVDLKMPPLIATIVARGLLRCQGGLKSGATSFKMSGPWESPRCL